MDRFADRWCKSLGATLLVPLVLGSRFMGVLLSLSAGAMIFAQDQARGDPQLEVVRAQYEQTISTMRTLWTRTALTIRPPAGEVPVADPVLGISPMDEHGTTIDWAFDGQMYHFQRFRPARDSLPPYRRGMSSDGKLVWFPEYGPTGEADDIRMAGTRPRATYGDAAFLNDESPARFIGLTAMHYCASEPAPESSVRSLLKGPSAEIIGVEKIDDRECVRVLLGDFQCSTNDEPAHVEAWFDLAAGGLPRRTRIGFVDGGENYQEIDYDVLEFQQVPSGIGDGRVWFPKVMRHGWEVFETVEVRVNDQLPGDLFRPRLPAGTFVLDYTNRDAVQKWQQQRMNAELAPEFARMAEEARQKIAAGPPALTTMPIPAIQAAPPHRKWWMVATGIGVLLLSGALFLWQRSR